LANAYVADQKLPPVLGVHCHTCQFRRGAKDKLNLLDGRHECWTVHGVPTEALDGQKTVLDLWNYRSKSDLIAQRRYLLSDITADDLKVKAGDGGPVAWRAAVDAGERRSAWTGRLLPRSRPDAGRHAVVALSATFH
jgi:hypothetical protein